MIPSMCPSLWRRGTKSASSGCQASGPSAISMSGTKETLVSKDQSNWSQGSRKQPCDSKRRSNSGSQSLHVRSRPSSASRPSGEPWTVSTRKSFQAGR